MNAHSPAIILHDVTTGYHSRGGNIEITRHIEAILSTSELTCLLGPNGAGKSTLLKTLASFIPPLHGGITIADRPLRDYSAGRLARTIGVVLTEKPSLNNMTVRELVGLGRSPYTGFWGKYTREDREIVDRALQLTGITEFAARQIQTLSDEERQKVMIAKSLAQQTPIILLDEPTAFLDYPSKVEIMQLLQRMAHEEGKAVFLSTHDLELALQISDKVWLIDKTNGLRIGTPEDLSLSGDMARYFEREGVVFDPESGLFRIDTRANRPINLRGAGPRAAMARKALRRIGFICDEHTESPIAVDVTDDSFMVNDMVCGSIEELLHAVRNLSAVADKDSL